MSFRLSACRGVLSPRAQLPCCSPRVFKLSRPNRINQRLLATSRDDSEAPSIEGGTSQHKQEAINNVAREEELTGSAKLLAEALVEEETIKAKEHWRELSEKEASSAPYVLFSIKRSLDPHSLAFGFYLAEYGREKNLKKTLSCVCSSTRPPIDHYALT
jgi:hypothetical protein